MFKSKRKSPPAATTTRAPSSSSVSRTTLVVSSSSACSTRPHRNVAPASSTSVAPQYSTYQKLSRQRHDDGKLLAMVHRHLRDRTALVSRRSARSTAVVRQLEVLVDFLLSTDHLRGYLAERGLLERKASTTTTTTTTLLPKLTLLVLLLSSLFPLTFASSTTASPAQITTINRDVFVFGGFGVNTSSITFALARRPQWHAGCCLRSNKTLLPVCVSSFNSTFSEFTGESVDDKFYPIDFLNDQTLFCERYNTFRRLTSKQLAAFTYSIVVIGIILNTFVFLVLMCGSLRRSTSFVLFLALTCFDLLSLASSLFALLFRTVMTYLKTSAPFCKMFGIFFLYFRQCSSTTLLLIAIERCIVIKYPFCRHTFDRFRLPLLWFIMFIFVAPIPFDFLFYTSGSLHCEAFDSTQAHYYQIFRGFLTVFSYAMVPFVGISISNFLIIMELKKSKKRFMTKDENGTMRRFSTNVVDKRGTTVMLLVASFAFVLLLGPFYVHWCIAYLFYNYPQCQFTRNLYENVQVCMGVFHPYLTVIEKGMRESNHAINFLLYWATSTRFRSDFKRISRRISLQIFGTAILFLYRHICFCCPEPSCLVTLERHVSDTTDFDSSYESNRKNHTAYKTSHYYSNYERRRQHQLVQATLMNSAIATDTNLTPTASLHTLTASTAKTVRMLTLNPHDPMMHHLESRRQATRLSKQLSTSGAV